MAVIAKLKYLRIAPRKVRLVADLIKKKKVERAQAILNFTTKKSALPLLKLLNSAVANARHRFQIEAKNLYVSKIDVDEGPKYKRWMPRARGMAYPIQKKTSHITLVLDEISPGKKIKKTKKEIKKPEQEKEPQKEKLHPPKFRKSGILEGKPKIAKGLKRIFRRKAF